MATRKFTIPGKVPRCAPCPKCGNHTSFTAHAERCAVDCCEVWVVCTCGYDPTEGRPGLRLEDTWGSLDEETIRSALACWDDAVAEHLVGAAVPSEKGQ